MINMISMCIDGCVDYDITVMISLIRCVLCALLANKVVGGSDALLTFVEPISSTNDTGQRLHL